MKFAEQLKTARESLGLNQAEAAALLECGKRTLEHWEAGTRTPLVIAQEGSLSRLRTTKRPRTRKGQNTKVSHDAGSGASVATEGDKLP